jgi:protein-S-isoprenylcysteine O-methyltransferase Ste14
VPSIIVTVMAVAARSVLSPAAGGRAREGPSGDRPNTVNDLNKRAYTGLLSFLTILAMLLFLPAWTLAYWQAWLFLAVVSVSTIAITIYLMKNDPKLLERRMHSGPKAEQEKTQRIIQSLAMVAFIAVIVFPVVDHRCGWSVVPAALALAGDILVALGFLLIFFVFKENTFASSIIEVGTEQTIVATGPYSIVRHPMYLGALVMLAGIPLALGTWWGLVTIIPMTIVLVWRLLDEEKFLARNLAGYSEYQRKVRYHLLPFIW